LDGTVELGNPHCADFPRPDLRLGSAFLAAADTVLLNFARAKITGDVNVRALLQAGRELGDLTEAGGLAQTAVLCGLRASEGTRFRMNARGCNTVSIPYRR
jgi:hypothetical protein